MRCILFSLFLLPYISFGKLDSCKVWLPEQYVLWKYNGLYYYHDSFAISRIELIESFKTCGNKMQIRNTYAERFGEVKLIQQKEKGLFKIENVSNFITYTTIQKYKDVIENCFVYRFDDQLKLLLKYADKKIDTINFIYCFKEYCFEDFTSASLMLEIVGNYSMHYIDTKIKESITLNIDGAVLGSSFWKKFGNIRQPPYHVKSGVRIPSNYNDFIFDVYDFYGIKKSYIALGMFPKKGWELYEFDEKTLALTSLQYSIIQ